MPRPRIHLPEPARAFFAANEKGWCRPFVRRFHKWLTANEIDLADLSSSELERFWAREKRERLSTSTMQIQRYALQKYFRWLSENGHLGFVVAQAPRVSRSLAPLPETAIRFIDTLRPVLKPATCKHYVERLRAFHVWLAVSKLDLDRFDRASAERWLVSLADRGLAPSTRCACIFMVRRYLEWLVERGELDVWPYDLLRIEDLPKIPSYLPRPFPVDADHELQRRFLENGTVYGQALFLMRRSGVRIGELVRLEPQCLVRDLRDNAFLKVPLGKLDNERLVPLDDQARDVLESLQRLCPKDAEFLILPEHARKKLIDRMSASLKDAAAGLDIPGPVVSHRLRHTYATELINAGLSLVTIMKLLGHRSFRMTMRYAAITQQTILDDYLAAIAVVSRKYVTSPSGETLIAETIPERQALDLISSLRKSFDSSPDAKHRADAIIKRIYKIRDDILAIPKSIQHN